MRVVNSLLFEVLLMLTIGVAIYLLVQFFNNQEVINVIVIGQNFFDYLMETLLSIILVLVGLYIYFHGFDFLTDKEYLVAGLSLLISICILIATLVAFGLIQFWHPGSIFYNLKPFS